MIEQPLEDVKRLVVRHGTDEEAVRWKRRWSGETAFETEDEGVESDVRCGRGPDLATVGTDRRRKGQGKVVCR
jgi:hypothetical protein